MVANKIGTLKGSSSSGRLKALPVREQDRLSSRSSSSSSSSSSKHGLRCSLSWLLPGALLAPSSLYHPCDDWMGEIEEEPLVMRMVVVVAVGVVVVGGEEEEGG